MLLALLALLASCAQVEQATQALVTVDGEDRVRDGADRLAIVVQGGAQDGELEEVERMIFGDDEGETIPWPRRLALVPRGGSPDRRFAVVATAFSGDGEVLAQARLISSYRRGRTLRLSLLLDADCVRVICESPDETCRDGLCVPGTVDPELDAGIATMLDDAGTSIDASLPPPDAPVDGGPTDTCLEGCDDGIACTEDRCRGGTCDYAPNDGLCDDGVACTRDTCPGLGPCINTPAHELCGEIAGGTCDPVRGCQYPACNIMTCGSTLCESAVCMGSVCLRTSLCAQDPEPCTIARCDPMLGCRDETLSDGTDCDDSDPCTVTSVCMAGVCTGTGPHACVDMNPCTADDCASGIMGITCSNVPLTGMACSDGNSCTLSDVCNASGSCLGTDRHCPGKTVCDPEIGTCA